MPGTRCFAAIELPRDARDTLLAAGEAIRGTDPSWSREKWVADENLHITLKFFGDLPEDVIGFLAADISEELAGVEAFVIALAGIQPVPSLRRCQMVWATFDDASGSGARVAGIVDRAGERYGVGRDSRRFLPHATLVRARRSHVISSEAIAVAEAPLVARRHIVSVPSVTFFASTLTRRGPVYETIAEWTL